MGLFRFLATLTFIIFLTANVQAQCEKKCTHDKTACEKTHQDHAVQGGKTVNIELPTLKCSMCKQTIETGLSKVDGILEIKVDVEKKTAVITYDPAKLDEAKIEQAISAVGYQANKTTADPKAYEKLAACCKHDKKS